MKFFLKLKHWQLFLIATVMPIFFYVFAFAFSIFQGEPLVIFKFFPAIWVVALFGYHSWMFSVNRSLHARIPAKDRPSLNLYYFFFFAQLAYFAAVIGGVMWLFTTLVNDPDSFSPEVFFLLLLLMIPLQLFVIFCHFYCIYVTAKTIKSAEAGRQPTLNELLLDGLLVWFYPVGIWFLQPRINRLAEAPLRVENADTDSGQL